MRFIGFSQVRVMAYRYVRLILENLLYLTIYIHLEPLKVAVLELAGQARPNCTVHKAVEEIIPNLTSHILSADRIILLSM